MQRPEDKNLKMILSQKSKPPANENHWSSWTFPVVWDWSLCPQGVTVALLNLLQSRLSSLTDRCAARIWIYKKLTNAVVCMHIQAAGTQADVHDCWCVSNNTLKVFCLHTLDFYQVESEMLMLVPPLTSHCTTIKITLGQLPHQRPTDRWRWWEPSSAAMFRGVTDGQNKSKNKRSHKP